MTRSRPDRSASGRAAERAVCAFLEDEGMEIVARNFRARGGEVDIVARRGNTVAFVEVRSRGDGEAVPPEETVGLVKRRRIVAAARAWLDAVPPSSWTEVRFDVAAVEGEGKDRVIRYYANAFDAKGKVL